jgi:hypothetical protein
LLEFVFGIIGGRRSMLVRVLGTSSARCPGRLQRALHKLQIQVGPSDPHHDQEKRLQRAPPSWSAARHCAPSPRCEKIYRDSWVSWHVFGGKSFPIVQRCSMQGGPPRNSRRQPAKLKGASSKHVRRSPVDLWKLVCPTCIRKPTEICHEVS